MTAATAWAIGDVVRYSDIMNPGSVYVVIEITQNPWSTYTLRSVDTPYAITYTDGRQRGWEVLS